MIKSAAVRLIAVGALSLSAHAHAQTNPFVPQQKIDPAELNKAIDARLKAQRPKDASATPSGAPSGAPGSPLMPGGAPGQIAPYGAPSGPMVPGAPGTMPGVSGVSLMPIGPVQTALAAGARFVGCLNGKHFFIAKSGLQLTFKSRDVTNAVREGAVPSCR